MRYLVLVHQDQPDGPVGVTVPDLPGCTSDADTLADVLAGAAEAIAGHVACLRDAGEDVPAPSASIDTDGAGRVAVVDVPDAR